MTNADRPLFWKVSSADRAAYVRMPDVLAAISAGEWLGLRHPLVAVSVSAEEAYGRIEAEEDESGNIVARVGKPASPEAAHA